MLVKQQVLKVSISALIVLCAVATIFVSCEGPEKVAPSTDSSKLTTVRIGTMGDAVDYAPFMVAIAKGWFTEEFAKYGVEKVETTSFQEVATLNDTIATGRVDIIFEAELPAIIGRTKAPDLRIVGISCSLQQEILVAKDSTIQTIAGLKGKKIAVPAGTSSHYNLLKILDSAGLTSEDVEIFDMSPSNGRIALESGRVDSWAIWPPHVEQQIVNDTGRVLPGTDALIHSIMSMRGTFQDEHPEIAAAAFGVLMRAKVYLVENSEDAKKLVAESLNLTSEVVELAWPKHDWAADLDAEVIADIQTKTEFLANQGLIPASFDVDSDLIFRMRDDL